MSTNRELIDRWADAGVWCFTGDGELAGCKPNRRELMQLMDTARDDTAAQYDEVLADMRRLVRELDVAFNTEAGAAKQASLVDIVSQVKSKGWKLILPNLKLPSLVFSIRKGAATTEVSMTQGSGSTKVVNVRPGDMIELADTVTVDGVAIVLPVILKFA